MSGRYTHIGAAIVPIELVDKANDWMRQQGYGPKVFDVPVGPSASAAITAVANFQPVNRPLAAALNVCVEQLGGDWMPIDEETNPARARAMCEQELLKSKLKIKRWKNAT